VTGVRTAVLRHVRTHPLVAFVALAYTFSWAWWIPLALSGARVRDGVGVPTQLPGLLGPLVAAVVVSAVEGRSSLQDLVRRMLLLRLPLRFWALLAGTMALGLAVVLAVDRDLVASDLLSYSGIGRLDPALVLVLVVVVNGFGEETGWRGFVVERLLPRHGPVRTALLTTLVWATWHLPMFFFVQGLRGLGPAAVGWLVGLTCGSIVLTWMYVGTGHSIAYCAMWHSAFNLTTATTATTGTPAAVSSTAVMVLAGVLVVQELRRHLRRRAAARPSGDGAGGVRATGPAR
jgi:CAAX protease family protein